MVKSVSSLTRNGFRDWIFQRVSALVVGLYVLFFIGYLMLHPHMLFVNWQTFFCDNIVRIFTLIVLVAVAIHAYVGLWTISTDYIKSTWMRFLFQVIVWLALFAFLIWGALILWSVV